MTFKEQVTGWHVTGHVGGQVTGQVIGHVIEMDGWLVTWWERLSQQVENKKYTLRKPKNVIPMVFHVLINGCITCPNHVWSCDVFDDQALGRSCGIFPGSCVVRSCNMLGTERSRVSEITWLELGLGAVVKQLVVVEWVLGSFGNVFLVGTSFAHNSVHGDLSIIEKFNPLGRLKEPVADRDGEV